MLSTEIKLDIPPADADADPAPSRAAELRLLASELLEVANRIERTAGSDTRSFPLGTAERHRMTLLALAEAEFTGRRNREAHFKKSLFGEPAWNMLLDLYVREGHKNPVTITVACGASGVSKAAALRWLDMLEEEGLIDRRAASHDRRMRFVRLTRAGREAISTWLVSRAALPA